MPVKQKQPEFFKQRRESALVKNQDSQQHQLILLQTVPETMHRFADWIDRAMKKPIPTCVSYETKMVMPFIKARAEVHQPTKPPARVITPQYAALPLALTQGWAQKIEQLTAMIVSAKKPMPDCFTMEDADS
jgi:hypothetical protein